MRPRHLRLALFVAAAFVAFSAGAQESSPLPAASAASPLPSASGASPIAGGTFHPLAASASAPFALSAGASGLTQALGCLFLLVALFGGGIYLVKNGNVFFKPGNKGLRKLVISETRMLGNRQFLVVAEYDDRKMLIGVCPGRIDYLCPLGARDDTFSTVLPEKPE